MSQATANKLSTEPLYLLKVIVYNNPAKIQAAMLGLGLTGASLDPSSLLDLVLEVGPSLSDGDWNSMFDFGPDPLGWEGAEILDSFNIVYGEELSKDHSVEPVWSDVFSEELGLVIDTFRDFNSPELDEEGEEDDDDATHSNGAKKPCGCGKKKGPDWFVILTSLAVVVLACVLIKNWK
ncbi:hypothetical protein [Phaeocystidibacter luteus]|uniref:Uncharacterized protein n=1 Tax=Phaeocystidibacter luteus TaxID=911197 RepID=A0A6N6RLW2_9FLAO|nr:hypothetical protein [Phaeocystidibacter luteus]KAB2814565.1 hypothetical protein F8C67_02160 [Phaeocystidibacter luteus]